MSEPLETRLFIHRLTQTEKAAVYAHSKAFPFSSLAASFASAVEDVCIDKLIRADGCLRLAQSLARDADNESQLKDSAFRLQVGLPEDTGNRVVEARLNRHVADYSPYDFQRDPPDTRRLGISNGSWSDAVQFNINLAEEVFLAAMKYIGS